MPQPLNCPTCGAPLSLPDGNARTTRCPYCQNEVLLPAELLPVAPACVDQTQTTLLAQIVRLIQSGQKIEAIKLYKNTYRTGLVEAKNRVEALQRVQSLDSTALIALPAGWQNPRSVDSPRRMTLIILGLFFLLLAAGGLLAWLVLSFLN